MADGDLRSSISTAQGAQIVAVSTWPPSVARPRVIWSWDDTSTAPML